LNSDAPDLIVHSVTTVDVTGVADDSWVLCRGGVIADRGRGDGWRAAAEAATVVDGAGGWLTPGFIDLHTHGGGGHANEDGGAEILAALAAHRRHGTTRSVISFVSNPIPQLCRLVAEVAALTTANPSVLGSHLEGPFLSDGRRGAHHPEHLTDPTAANVDALLGAARGTLRQLTIDPARPGALAAIATVSATGAVVAVGHTEADYAVTTAAFDAGATLLTHAFNAMPGIHHRHPGPVLAALDDPRVTLELILDGEHVHPSVGRLLMTAAPGRVALITDAIAASAAPDGHYLLGDVAVDVVDRQARVSGTATLAGSTLTQDRALQCALQAGIPVPVAVGALSHVPARALGLAERLGLVRPGYLADLVLFEPDWTVRATYLSALVA
jgi:N-acetylglucosamine-6-phosphate deacetylase